MKKLIVFLLLSFVFFSFRNYSVNSLSEKERKLAVKQLKQSRSDLHRDVNYLTENQLKYKPDSTRWSVYECMQHITLAKNGLWQMFIAAMKEPADPSKKADVKVTDEELLGMIIDRSKKAQAPEPFRPEKSTFTSSAQVLESFDAQMENMVKYINKTEEDLRNRFIKMPFGTIDAYQLILMIAAHNQRHIKQIEEVMADPKFPKG
ncbi:MAG: DinB family protein [Chitinophagaceae bacterium]